ncbi:MAG: hypothetical protein FWF56_01460 [Firmicutes bacterium]|nr:hypothetical protein [Bacillota bacterium]
MLYNQKTTFLSKSTLVVTLILLGALLMACSIGKGNSISFHKDEVSVKAGSTVDVGLDYSMENSSIKVESSNPDIATAEIYYASDNKNEVEGVRITGVANGQCQIIVSLWKDDKEVAKDTLTVTVTE